ncbi:hypothetical protein Dsin_001050 [Dipteronia sinensis]|uniref:RRM domain-containing protein n=1 Tax=Dipteronia sinensis TaxID=43782 RepID=A0AAE0B4M7_9ROSI|nr:hypothetical protein Dsin_001050 [Dipteronia sinensis]
MCWWMVVWFGVSDVNFAILDSVFRGGLEAVHGCWCGSDDGFCVLWAFGEDSAQTAINAMDGQELNGRSIRVSFANERPSGPRSNGGGGGYGGGGGGYRGGYGNDNKEGSY